MNKITFTEIIERLDVLVQDVQSDLRQKVEDQENMADNFINLMQLVHATESLKYLKDKKDDLILNNIEQ